MVRYNYRVRFRHLGLRWAIMGVTSGSLVVPRDYGNQENSALTTLTLN